MRCTALLDATDPAASPELARLAEEWVPKGRRMLEQWLRYRSMPQGLEIEDVVQESLGRGWQWSLVHGEAPPAPLLRVICHNYLVSAYRRAAAHPENMVAMDIVTKYVGSWDEKMLTIEWQLTLEKILPYRDRQWLWQHYVGGESLIHIGIREKVTPAAVKMRLFRARRRLQQDFLAL